MKKNALLLLFLVSKILATENEYLGASVHSRDIPGLRAITYAGGILIVHDGEECMYYGFQGGNSMASRFSISGNVATAAPVVTKESVKHMALGAENFKKRSFLSAFCCKLF